MKKGKIKYPIFLICVLCLLNLYGCFVYVAAKQPEKRNIDLFKVGTPRSILLAEFGYPVVSEVREDGKKYEIYTFTQFEPPSICIVDGNKYEIYTFTQGYSGAAKAGRAISHGAADVFTLGLWEVVGTPTEGAFDGTEMAYEVKYDENDKVDQVVLLKKK